DANRRLEFLQRSIRIIETFHDFFSSTIFDDFNLTTSINQLSTVTIRLLRPLLTFKDRLISYNMLTDTDFLHIKQQYFQDTNNDYNINASLLKSFDRVQSFPIRSA
ncbi:unnamed protein product, partial [Rotaria socialis]